MKLQRMDRVVILVAAAALLALAALIWLGGSVRRPVRRFEPQGEALPLSSRIALEAAPGVDVRSLRDHLVIEPAIAGEWRFEGRWLRFQPEDPLPAETSIQVSALPGIETSFGLTRERFEWGFRTRGLRIGSAEQAGDGSTRIMLRGLDGAEIAETARLPGPVRGIALLPDARLITSVENSAGGADLWIVSEAGDSRLLLNCGSAGCINPVASPRGTLLIYERYETRLSQAQLFTLDVERGRSEAALLIGSSQGTAPFFSDAGRLLGFSSPNELLLRVIDFDSQGEYQIPVNETLPGSFSEARLQLVYADIRVVGGSFYPTLWTAGLQPGEGLHLLLDDPQEDFNPAWSPDGALIAFARRYIDRRLGPVAQPALLDVERGTVRLLDESNTLNSLYFSWDPSGRWLLVQRYDVSSQPARSTVWLYDREDGSFRELIAVSGPPFWWP